MCFYPNVHSILSCIQSECTFYLNVPSFRMCILSKCAFFSNVLLSECAFYLNVQSIRLCILLKCAFYPDVHSIQRCTRLYISMYTLCTLYVHFYVHGMYIIWTWFWYTPFMHIWVYSRNVHNAHCLYHRVDSCISRGDLALWYKSNYVDELKALGFGAEGSSYVLNVN